MSTVDIQELDDKVQQIYRQVADTSGSRIRPPPRQE